MSERSDEGASPLPSGAAITLIADAQSRDEIVVGLLRAARAHAAYAAVFSVQDGMLRGRLALAGDAFVERAALPSMSLAGDTPLRAVVRSGAPQLGELGGDEGTRTFLAALGRAAPMRAALIPVSLRQRTVAVLYVDHGGARLPALLLADLGAVVAAASRAFETVVAAKKTTGKMQAYDPSPQADEAPPVQVPQPRATAEATRAPAPPSSDQHRRDDRVSMTVAVDLESEHNFYTGITGNISTGGLFVATYVPPANGAQVQLDLQLDGQTHHLGGTVCWIRDAAHETALSPAGFGIRFHEHEPTITKAIAVFIAKRDTIFFDDE